MTEAIVNAPPAAGMVRCEKYSTWLTPAACTGRQDARKKAPAGARDKSVRPLHEFCGSGQCPQAAGYRALVANAPAPDPVLVSIQWRGLTYPTAVVERPESVPAPAPTPAPIPLSSPEKRHSPAGGGACPANVGVAHLDCDFSGLDALLDARTASTASSGCWSSPPSSSPSQWS